jgi:anti-sigma regulatory factor (Ser/Thr protein kinase)
LQLFDQTESIRIGVALEEALLNAIFHGNLEVSSELRQEDERHYYRQAGERCGQFPYRDRRVVFNFKMTHEEARFSVEDEGQGFDLNKLPDPTDPENLDRIGGRGLFLVRTFMDEVQFNKKGNRVVLVKRKRRH